MIATGISLALGAIAIGGYKLYQSNVDSKIASAEVIIKAASAEKLIDFIGKEKIANEKTYINNQLLINQYGPLKEIVEVLNKQTEVANFQTRNSQIYNTITKSLNADIVAIDTLYKMPYKTRDEKIASYVGNNNLNIAKKWEDAIVTNQFVNVGNMMDLNKQIKDSVKTMEQVKKEVLEQVQTRIKNGDFDLNAAQSEFAKSVAGQTQTQINELNQAKKDLAELKNQSVQNEDGSLTKTDPNAQNIITDKDLNEASSALNTYQTQAINQINSDREKVEQLIAEAKQQTNSNNQTNIVNTNTPSQNSNVVVNRGPSFFDYYLMYSWMNSVTSSNRNNTTVNYPSGNSYKSQVKQVDTASYKTINIPKSNMYDMNNNNSYLNKQLEKTSTFGKSNDELKKVQQFEKSKVNITEIRNKIAESRVKVEQAKTVRANEIKRIDTAKTNKYEAAAAKSYKSSSVGISNKSTSSYKPSGRK